MKDFFKTIFKIGILCGIVYGISKLLQSWSNKTIKKDDELLNKLRNSYCLQVIEEEKRNSQICNFNSIITKDFFDQAAFTCAKQIKRIMEVRIEGVQVIGLVRSQSGISDWEFTVDFNDYGTITGKTWVTSSNYESDIPFVFANRMSKIITEKIEANGIY